MNFGEVSSSRWSLRSSRVTQGNQGDADEEESLLKPSGKKRPWKAKREDSDDETGAIPLSRTSGSRLPDACVEAEVQPGETLASIALKYNVQVSELKRVNNLFKDAEFYALKRVKIPVKPASLLTETLPQALDKPYENGWYIHTAATSSTVQSSTPVSETDNGSQTDEFLVDLGQTPPPPVSKETKKASKFLRNVDRELHRIREKTERLSVTPERDELSLSTMSPSGNLMTTTLVMPTAHRDPSWCSKSGLVCAFLIVISVLLILALAYLGYHSKMFVSHSEIAVHPTDDDENDG